MILVLDKDYAKVEHFEELKLIKIVWKTHVSSEEYKYVMITAIEYAEKIRNIDNFLSDIRNQGVINPITRKWFENEMIPRSIKLGLKRSSVIFSGNIFTKYYLNNISGVTKKLNLPFKFFIDEESAYQWIKSFN